jgi:hypothetical protein
LAANKKNSNGKSSNKPATEVTAEDLWIAPKSNLKGDNGDRAWNDRTGAPTGSRLLELADIALGLKKPEPFKKRRSAAAGADTSSSA